MSTIIHSSHEELISTRGIHQHNRHQHHNHKRHLSNIAASPSYDIDMPTSTSQVVIPSASSWADELVARSTFVQSTHSTLVTVMPSLVIRDEEKDSGDETSMPSLSETSSSSSSSISTTITAIPNSNNPYIDIPTLPTSLVFIIVGSILGAILLALTLYRIINHYIYSSKAQLEKETYYSTTPGLGDMSQHYAFPHQNLKRNGSSSSLFDLSSNSSSTLSQGKSLQNHILSDKQQFRKSMFNNPSLEYDSLSLPLYQDKRNSSSMYLQKYNNNSSAASLLKPTMGPYLDSATMASSSCLDNGFGNGDNRDTDSEKLGTTGTFAGSVQTTLRPPSMFLEDLLNGKDEEEEEKGK
ncbi:hypothetical protein CANMA_002318 [Candida margitis]|uniref:uncharacterized protein n=1 Tax=Candida margitis TaxID=1775924 RepID=UPI00222734C1|nr:uncharacterized protein CANMA_002318 [Candida margitis]KAI5968573.1 hypothetical protein CANMA_002318 [Candida margitis]